MSISSAIDANNPDPIYRGKFYPDLIPFEHPPAQQNLGQVLAVGNQALNPTTGLPQDATDFNIIGCVKIETGTIGMGNQPALVIGEPGDILQIKGGTALGSILVGNGADTEELVCPTTTTTATTGTIYNWLSLANGQSRDFFTSNGALYQVGYSITIVYSGTDSITGTITAVVGNLVTLTIVSFTSAVYTPATLITTTPPDPVTATSGGGDPTFIFNPVVCTPTTIPNNSFLLTGLCYLYGAPPVVGSSNITLTAQASPPAINGTTSIFSIPQYENPPVSTSAFSWGSAGCFIPDGTSVTLASNAGGNQLAFAFPSGGSFINQDFTGSISGYSLAYTPDGVITINSKLVLTADNTKPLGVFWGVDAQGVGTVTSVSAGNNISISGSLSAPVVNLQQPLTSTLGMGSVALTDKNGASGSAGQYLTAGAGGETLWATLPTSVASVTAGRNIDITGTATNPTIALDNPLTDTLNMGTQSVFYGASTAVPNATSTATETIYQAGGVAGGAQTAYYGFNACSVVSGSKQIGIDGNGITNVDGSTGTQLVKNQSSPTQIEIISKNQISTSQTTSTITSSSVRCDTDNAGGIIINNVMTAGIGTNAESFLTYTDSGANKQQQQALITNGTENNFSQTYINTTTGDALTTEIRTEETALITQALFQSKVAGGSGDTTGTINLQTDPTNPLISLGQSAPFATTFSTTWNKDGILQNNSAGTGFNLQTAQDINLIAPIGNFINVSNGNEIKLLDPTATGYTASFNNQGVDTTFFQAGVASSNADLTNAGNPQLFLSTTNLATPQAQFLRLEVPQVGDTTIEHGVVGVVRNLNMTSPGNISITATGDATLQGSGANVVCSATSINGTAQVFQNFSSQSGTSATPNFIYKEVSPSAVGACVIRMDKAVAPTAGNAISAISSYAIDGTATPREWSRIQTKVENVGAGNQDGTLSIFNSVNGSVLETFNFNGAQNENNSFRPLDMNNNDIRTSTGNILLTGTLSSGVGSIELKTKDAVAGAGTGLILTGNTLLKATAGGNSGQHLCLTINGVVYKIALLNA